jgi:hypothetical protein
MMCLDPTPFFMCVPELLNRILYLFFADFYYNQNNSGTCIPQCNFDTTDSLLSLVVNQC